MIEDSQGVRPRAAHLLDRPAHQLRQPRGLPPDGRGDLDAVRRAGRRVRPVDRHDGLTARESDNCPQTSPSRPSGHRRRTSRVRGAVRRPARRPPHRRHRNRLPTTDVDPALADEVVAISSADAEEMARRWPGKRACSPERPPARTSSRPSTWGNASGPPPRSPPCWWTRA